MAIQYLILLSRQGKVRLAKWFTTLSPKDKAKIVKDVSQLVLARRTRMCNFLEYKDTKIVYRRYASLFFIAGCSSGDNELISLEIIHRYVEQMDKYYGNVCELDIIFSFTKAYYILDELLLAGELQESSKKNVLRCIGQQDSLEDMEGSQADTARRAADTQAVHLTSFAIAMRVRLSVPQPQSVTRPPVPQQPSIWIGPRSRLVLRPKGSDTHSKHAPKPHHNRSPIRIPLLRHPSPSSIAAIHRRHPSPSSIAVIHLRLPSPSSISVGYDSSASNHHPNRQPEPSAQTRANVVTDTTPFPPCRRCTPTPAARPSRLASSHHSTAFHPAVRSHPGASASPLATLTAPTVDKTLRLRFASRRSPTRPCDGTQIVALPIASAVRPLSRPSSLPPVVATTADRARRPTGRAALLPSCETSPRHRADIGHSHPAPSTSTTALIATRTAGAACRIPPPAASAPLSFCRARSRVYLPVQDFEPVTRALNFNTPDCNVTGGCDLYTTKSTGSDKKLYRNIDKDLSSQHDALVKLGASLSPPDRAQMLATSPNMQLFSTSSAFGPLSDLSSRRTFAYLIATLNASHPHYDFSHVLRPGDFKRERNLRRVMVNLDSILQNVRPGFEAASFDSSLGSDLDSIWGPQCWSLIDKEMRLNECTLFSYHPDPDPFEEDESAIWAVHYFFFNRALKRVAYLYVRVVPVVSSTSPTLTPIKVGQHKRQTDFAADDAAKRARYWLGDRQAELVPPFEDDEDPQDDGLFWNRGEDGDLVPFSDDDYFEELEDDGELEDGGDLPLDQGHDRMMSEDVAGELEM
ncbi:mitogen-activated protein kinase MAF1 [Drechmeria coniospora]|uniref:AP-1 complex subunit sigma-1 n=1 Tax=Drechmeria coniospora TaxID=98403 RepID=A0A151GVD8_DRECN|nr:mitogen-activated protein kinase MAF1 [Drechmeria coniospora]KYK60992.1 mitogen-activated protein kinase MAF1 [Drechmeria coniospora]